MVEEISVVIIIKNGEKTIANTLEAIQDFDDVVIYDNGSTDKTLAIVNKYPNVNLVQGDFSGFGPTKNKAATHAQFDWILSLDADEVVDKEFLNSLKIAKLNRQTVYQIFRKNFYQNTHIKHCWSNDKITRLYHRKRTQFDNKKVHEKVLAKGLKVELLTGFVDHYPYANISDFIKKVDVYSSEFAYGNIGKRASSPVKAVLNSGFSFFKTYFLKRGFLDGYAGLVIAFSHMATNFYKYIKLYELNKKK